MMEQASIQYFISLPGNHCTVSICPETYGDMLLHNTVLREKISIMREKLILAEVKINAIGDIDVGNYDIRVLNEEDMVTAKLLLGDKI